MERDRAAVAVEAQYKRARIGIQSLTREYYRHNATAVRCVRELLTASGEKSIVDLDFIIARAPLDHIAIRSFGTRDLGIDGLRVMFEELGYVMQEEVMRFETKRVVARWLAPPRAPDGFPPLPRIFLSELDVDACDEELKTIVDAVLGRTAQGEVRKSQEEEVGRVARWQLPSAKQYAQCEKMSEYAAWTLLHGYRVNHVEVSVFQLMKMYPDTLVRDLDAVEACLASNAATARARWNETSGKTIVISPDGLLAQSALMAEPCRIQLYKKSEENKDRYGTKSVEDVYKEYSLPGTYLEFVVRLPKPEHANKAFEDLLEEDLRDGFETANANVIFDSTGRGGAGAGGAARGGEARASEEGRAPASIAKAGYGIHAEGSGSGSGPVDAQVLSDVCKYKHMMLHRFKNLAGDRGHENAPVEAEGQDEDMQQVNDADGVEVIDLT